MPKTLRWKWIVIAAVLLGCAFGVIGLPTSWETLAANWNRRIRLGLDLKGGMHIVLQVQVQDAFKAEAGAAMDRLTKILTPEGIAYESIERNDPDSVELAETIHVVIRGVAPEKANDLRRVVTASLGQQWLLSQAGATEFRLSLRREAAVKLRQDTLAQTINTMERRVNGLGLADASIQSRGGSDGETEIVVQLPGVDDPARAKNVLQTAAILELCEVKDGPFPSAEAARARHQGVLPLNTKLVRGAAFEGDGETWWLLERSPEITGRDLRDARAQPGDAPGRWDTGFVLTQDAARRFERYTETSIGRRLAIVVDGLVLSAPSIDSRISDQGRILGMRDQQQAADLALSLRSGSLPSGLKVVEEYTVGPSLGADSIRKGVTAGLVGLVLVAASMILYYRGAGLNAVFALLLNTIITVAALSYLDATWTLPGIAGLVLSIGMAVDSNVLIFERIKEELRAGTAAASAIAAGFDRALMTIIDTHVTTVVASAFLFVFGTVPVRGFAVTLVIGLAANLFTAVYVSRAIFDYQLWHNPRLKHVSIGAGLFRQAGIDFLSRRYLALGISALAIGIGAASLAMRGPVYGLDFRGGALITVKFAPAPSTDELRGTLSAALPGDITVQESQGGEFLIGTPVAEEASLQQVREAVVQSLGAKYGDLAGKLDLNNASQAALAERLGRALPDLSEVDRQGLAQRILDFRDRVKGGLIAGVGELARVAGIDSSALAAIERECGAGAFNLRSAGIVGPRAGAQLRQQAALATGGALAGMLAYIAFRFQWAAGAAAVIATAHDVAVTLGLFSLLGREINLTIVAALLTLIGYSMNDKIVVFDRVRENLRAKKRAGSFLDLVNLSINQTLSRTLLTAGPTLLACLALYFLGGDVLNGMAFALLAGIVAGTYSSIFIASALLVMWERRGSGTAA